jgi:uncharacterized membrane protein
MLAEGFDRIPVSSQYIHLASLFAIAISTALLMTPAAYHRVAVNGQDTEAFHRLAGRLLIAAMAALAVGLSGDFFVVVRKITGSAPFASAMAALTLAFISGLWFGFTCYKRSRLLRDSR